MQWDVTLKRSLCLLTPSRGIWWAMVCASTSELLHYKNQVIGSKWAPKQHQGQQKKVVVEEGAAFNFQKFLLFHSHKHKCPFMYFKDIIILTLKLFLLALLTVPLGVSSFYCISFFFCAVFSQTYGGFLFCLSCFLVSLLFVDTTCWLWL